MGGLVADLCSNSPTSNIPPRVRFFRMTTNFAQLNSRF
jgi:hypothetical protein